MKQRGFFPIFEAAERIDAPASHTYDPPTSSQALANHEANGKRKRHANLVLWLVLTNPGQTAVELWELAPKDIQDELAEMQEVRRRLTDLQHAGLVRQSVARRCRVRGTSQVTWLVT